MKAHAEQMEEDHVIQFLIGLNDTYNVVILNVLILSPLPNVRQAYSLVIQEETQWGIASEQVETFLLLLQFKAVQIIL